MRFCYLNAENKYPQDRHLLDGLRELGHVVSEISDIRCLKEEALGAEAIIVGFTSPLAVISARLKTKKKIVFNAIASQFEANIISRREFGFLGFRAIKWWIIDFLSFHMASKVLLESDEQIKFISRLFFVPRKKLIRSFSGLSEKEFYFDPAIKKRNEFTVLFRGRFLPESGILTVIEAAKKLEGRGVNFIVIGHGFLYREVNALMDKLAPSNLSMMNEYLPIDVLRNLMLSSHVSLGQVANHPRLARTLPCKLFESLALRLPYITARNKAVFEILRENETCIVVIPGDSDDLVEKILELRQNPDMAKNIAEAGYRLYRERLTSRKLASDVLNDAFNI